MKAMVRELRAGETDLLRRSRLRALAEYPDTFAESVTAAAARPASDWDLMAVSLLAPSRQRMFLLQTETETIGEGEIIGSVFALLDQNDAQGGRVGGMWVAAAHCGQGYGRALLNAVIDWARANDLVTLRLWVGQGDAPARRLYRRAGFEPTGVQDASRQKVDKVLVEMALSLAESF